MRISKARLVSLSIGAIAMTVGLGCSPASSNPTPLPTVSAAEINSISTTVQTASALAQATQAAQGALTNVPPNAKAALANLTIGTCPVMTANQSSTDALQVDATVDFGAGCTPSGLDRACSGSVSAVVTPTERQAQLTFNTLDCGLGALAGTMAGTYGLVGGAGTLDGSWNLTLTNSQGTATLTGTASASYDPATVTVTIQSFSGQAAQATDTFNVEMTGVQVPLQNNPRLLPSAGTVTISGSGVTTLTIQFDANTPNAGQVQVTIGGVTSTLTI